MLTEAARLNRGVVDIHTTTKASVADLASNTIAIR
jgi:hypothetical protein